MPVAAAPPAAALQLTGAGSNAPEDNCQRSSDGSPVSAGVYQNSAATPNLSGILMLVGNWFILRFCGCFRDFLEQRPPFFVEFAKGYLTIV